MKSLTESVSRRRLYLEEGKAGRNQDEERQFKLYRISKSAARYGRLEIIQFAAKQGLDQKTKYAICVYAAGGGHLKILEWALANRFPLSARICIYAAGGGHLEVINWARQTGVHEISEDALL
jgi:hypothetical protein